MKNILIFGACSAIAEATARQWARQGHRFYLIARDTERLAALRADLEVRGAQAVAFETLDANAFAEHQGALERAAGFLGGIDIALIAHGQLPDQAACEADFAAARTTLDTNGLSVLSLLTHLANRMEAQRHGAIAVIGSVAGDRGRASNYVYGAAKALVETFTDGLRQRLHAAGVSVTLIKPGFVDTPMTASFRKGALWVSPDVVARGIVRSVARARPIAYLPAFWWPIMFVIRHLPQAVFNRLKF